MMINFLGGEDEDEGNSGEEPIAFLSFEPVDNDERPPAPPEDDFPLGCEVELVDAVRGKEAQSSQFWEPIMDHLFFPKSTVRVLRHSGDYAFVVGTVGDTEVGCSLYRACLKEPKVKFKRYNPYAGAQNDENESGRLLSGLEGSDPLAHPILPDHIHKVKDPGTPDITSSVSPPFQTNVTASSMPVPGAMSHNQQHGEDPSTVTLPPTMAQQDQHVVAPVHHTSSAPVASTAGTAAADAARKYRDQGNRSFRDGRFAEAVTAYTAALHNDKKDAVRVLSNRSAASLALRQTEQALNDARAVIKLAPRSINGYMRAGNVLRTLRRYDEARSFYNKALQLEPQNGDVTYALLSNAAAVVFRSKTEHMPLEVVLHHKTLQLQAVSRRRFATGDIVFTESAHAAVPFIDSEDGGTADDERPVFCGECHRSLIHRSVILRYLQPGAENEGVITNMFVEGNRIPCSEGCGATYCCEHCRNHAWTNHHWLECPRKGKWGEGIAACKQLVRSQNGAHRRDILTSVWLTVRMVVTMCSSGKALGEAVGNFVWLQEGQLSLQEEAVVDQVLRPVHAALQQHFGREENALLDWSLFLKTFRQVRHNAICRRCSPWKAFIQRVEAQLSFLQQSGGAEQGNTANSVGKGLAAVLRAEGSAIPGLETDVMMVFDVFAVVCDEKHQNTDRNAQLRTVIETSHNVAVIAKKSIRKGEIVTASISASASSSSFSEAMQGAVHAVVPPLHQQ